VRLLERIEATKRLWSILCPRIDAPSDTWIAKWCTDHPDSIIEVGITRVGQKFENEQLADITRAHRYATSVLRNLAAAGISNEGIAETNVQYQN
jgi:hypothetical protein